MHDFGRFHLYQGSAARAQNKKGLKSGQNLVFTLGSLGGLIRIVPQMLFAKIHNFFKIFLLATPLSSDFNEIWPKVAEYGFPSFATNVYTWKNLDLKIIHLIPQRTIGLRKRKVFDIRYEQKLYLILLGESNEMKNDPYI